MPSSLMARHPRYCVPGQPQHVIQRGNNRTATFLDSNDFQFYQLCLLRALTRLDCELHAYVLMSNHCHLLISPRTNGGVSKVMQSIGRRYVGWFNKRYARTGGLWEGRFRATVIDTEEYLFECYRYIELNPVRAGLVDKPAQYAWSSFATNALGAADPLITPHNRYLALGSSPKRRQAAYRGLFRFELDPGTIKSIRDATNKAWALGNNQFRLAVSRYDRRAYPLVRWRDATTSRDLRE
jgi:putative transposase